ncbi:MAG: F-type H+-transporting ATPase subunit b [Actinomycetota bacterium]|jgi:F-type H+-transporting ATPase subunit b|nr:F-type H+-transporting ATPase subunit b [Actinomycetota bacterium]
MTTLASGNFLIPDGTLIAELIVFIIILAVIWKFIVPPLQKSMTARQEAIKKSFDDAEAAKQRLAEAEAEYKQALADARAEQAKAREDAAATKREIVDAAKAEAQTEAAAILARAEAALEVERRQVFAELRSDIGKLAVDLAERVVGESLADDERQSRVVDNFIAGLENAPASAGAGESR